MRKNVRFWLCTVRLTGYCNTYARLQEVERNVSKVREEKKSVVAVNSHVATTKDRKQTLV